MSLLRTSVLLIVCAVVFAAACHGSQSPRRVVKMPMEETKTEKKEEKNDETKEEIDKEKKAAYDKFKKTVEEELMKTPPTIMNLMGLKTATMASDEQIDEYKTIAKTLNDTDLLKKLNEWKP